MPAACPPPPITTVGISRFRCIGEACEDDCCHGWDVSVDQVTFRRLRGALGGSAAGRAELAAAVIRHEGEAAKKSFASMRLVGHHDRCSFLSPRGLCTVHARFGEGALPPICAAFPRAPVREGDAIMIWGKLSCPELVRQCLLAVDGADVVEVPAALDGLVEVARHGSGETGEPALLARARALGLALLADEAHPVSTRLALLARLAWQLEAGAPSAAIEAALAPAAVAEFADQLAIEPLDEELPARLLGGLVGEPARSAFSDFVARTFARLGSAAGVDRRTPGQISIDPARLTAALTPMHAQWQLDLGARLDLAFANFAKLYWLGDWSPHEFRPWLRARSLLARTALLRLLLAGHAELCEASTLGSVAARAAALDRALVELVYRFTRTLEHREHMPARLTALVRAAVTELDHAFALARAS